MINTFSPKTLNSRVGKDLAIRSITPMMMWAIMFCSACASYHSQEEVGLPTEFLSGDVKSVKTVKETLKEIRPKILTHSKRDKKFFKAAYKGNIKKIRSMLKEGYDANVTDKDGNNALIWAVKGKNVEIVEELSNNSFSWDVINDAGKNADYYIDMIADPEKKEKIINIRDNKKE